MRTLFLALVFAPVMTGQNWPVTLTAEDGPNQSVTLHLKNGYSAPLTAYLVGHRHSGVRDWSFEFNWMDVAMNNLPEEGIAQDRVTDIKVAKASAPAAEWKLQAVVFADGTVAGDARAVNALLDARVHTYQDLGRAIAMLTAKPASLGDLAAWQKENSGVPMPRAGIFLPEKRVVPQRVMKLLNDGKSEAEVVKMLNDWRDRLAVIQPPIPTKPRPERGVL